MLDPESAMTAATSAMTFLLQVKDRIHLARIMRNVKKMQNVKSVSRDSA